MADKQSSVFPTGSVGKSGNEVERFDPHPDSNEEIPDRQTGEDIHDEKDDDKELHDFKIWIDQEEGLYFNEINHAKAPPTAKVPTVGDNFSHNDLDIIDMPRPHDVVGPANLEEEVQAQAMADQANAFFNANEPPPQQENDEANNEHGAENDNRSVEEEEDPIRPPPQQEMFHVIPQNNNHLINYVITTLQAYLTKNGELLSNCLSLRDSHIFFLINTVNYLPHIWENCDVHWLSDALLHHLEAIRALIYKDLNQAVHHQRLLVYAVNRLLHEFYQNDESWTIPLIRTSRYDLRIVTHKAEEMGRGRRPGFVCYCSVVQTTNSVQIVGGICHYLSNVTMTRQLYRR